MVFLLAILGIIFMLCLFGCIYFARKLYISGHSTRLKEELITFEQGEYRIPVLINTNKNGKVRILMEDQKMLLIFLIFALGIMALIFGLVIGLVVVYNIL